MLTSSPSSNEWKLLALMVVLLSREDSECYEDALDGTGSLLAILWVNLVVGARFWGTIFIPEIL